MKKAPHPTRWLWLLLPLWLLSACGDSRCHVPIGNATFTIDPNSAMYSQLNHVGGYMYFTGGHRGVIVIRTSYTDFLAYERTCPLDTTAAVAISDEWGSVALECPACHSLFLVDADGSPANGSATPCSLFQYSTTYNNGLLYVY